jgi:hypothetical protein
MNFRSDVSAISGSSYTKRFQKNGGKLQPGYIISLKKIICKIVTKYLLTNKINVRETSLDGFIKFPLPLSISSHPS